MKCSKRILSAVSGTKQKEESEEIRKLFRMLIISHGGIGRGGGVKSLVSGYSLKVKSAGFDGTL